MPANLVTRIDSILATEAAKRVAGQPATEAGHRDLPVRPARGRRRPRLSGQRTDRAALRLPVPAARALATAAAVIAVGFGGYVLISHAGISPPASSSSHGTASGPLTTQVSLGPSVTYRQNHSSRTIQTVTANTNFQPATLADQASAALSQAKTQVMRSGSTKGNDNIYGSLAVPTSSSNSATLGGQAAASAGSAASQLTGCVDRVIKPGQIVLLVERAKFEGQSATIIVTAPASGNRTSPPKEAEIWALGDACSATTSDVLDHVKVAHL